MRIGKKGRILILLVFVLFSLVSCRLEGKTKDRSPENKAGNQTDQSGDIKIRNDNEGTEEGSDTGSDDKGNQADQAETKEDEELSKEKAGKTMDVRSLPQPETDVVSDTMYQKAVPVQGNLARLAAVMRRAEKGEDITVGVIGGSITQGSSATSTQNTYAYRFYQWWEQAFPQAKIRLVNAGIGATTSYLGVHRVDQELLSEEPDVVIVEFSVNDSDTRFFKESYEALVRKLLKAEQSPAVLLLFMTMEDGTSAEPSHMHIGFLYDLPRISYRQAVLKEIEEGRLTWKEISPDNIHPNDKGHALVGELLWKYLNEVYAKLDTIETDLPALPEPFFTEAYDDAVILDSTAIEPIELEAFEKSRISYHYSNSWTATEGEASIIFETEAQNIGIMYYKQTDGRGGLFEVYVDGENMRTLDADFSGGWGSYADTIQVYRSKEKKLHRIEIKKAATSGGDRFHLLGLLIS